MRPNTALVGLLSVRWLVIAVPTAGTRLQPTRTSTAMSVPAEARVGRTVPIGEPFDTVTDKVRPGTLTVAAGSTSALGRTRQKVSTGYGNESRSTSQIPHTRRRTNCVAGELLWCRDEFGSGVVSGRVADGRAVGRSLPTPDCRTLRKVEIAHAAVTLVTGQCGHVRWGRVARRKEENMQLINHRSPQEQP